MKVSLLIGCVALGLVGCATEHYRGEYRGGVNSPYETEYGTSWTGTTLDGMPYWQTRDSIYPVTRQPSINGTEGGSVKPFIDPKRFYDWDKTHGRAYERAPELPPPPSEIIP